MVLLYQSALSGLLMGLKSEVSRFCWVYVFLFFRMIFGKRKSFFLESGNTLDVSSTSAGRLFKEGLLTSLSNPKPILFSMAVFPQFIDTEQA